MGIALPIPVLSLEVFRRPGLKALVHKLGSMVV